MYFNILIVSQFEDMNEYARDVVEDLMNIKITFI